MTTATETQVWPSGARPYGRALPLWKRTLDLTLLCVLAIGALIVGLVVTAIILIGSKGPIFFRQVRVGYKGQKFRCYKFRTMMPDAEVDSHRELATRLIKSAVPMEKLDAKRDPRLIPFAGILRAGGLDELPQLYNVLRGEMSIVGPRPCIPYECEAYQEWHWHRFDALPGLTGLWQVSGKNRTTFEQMVKLDIAYAQNMSPWLDLWIIARTPFALFNQYRDLKAAKSKKALSQEQNTKKD